MIETAIKIQNPVEKAGYDMIYLVTCSLHGIIPEQSIVEQMDLTVLYRMAKYHSLTAMIFMALESTDILLRCKDVQLVKTWKDAKEKAIRKNLMLDVERNEILSFMEREGIWYLPLKGILLKEMYPKLGMRQMADNDILYDEQYQKELLTFMTKRGYKASQIGKGNHDVYTKVPVYNYELHTALYGSAFDKSWEEYYRNVKQRMLKDRDNGFGYHFKAEDFYTYLMTHAYKHYSGSGIGLRSLVDTYVYLQQKEAKFNWHYVSVELEELRITEFERESRQLCKKLFSQKRYSLTQMESEALTYYLGCGTYGTMKNNIEKKLRKCQPDEKAVTIVTKLKYYFGRLIPDMQHYKNYAPIVYQHKMLIPFYLIFRLIRGAIRKRKLIINEIHIVHKIRR
ncbi:MAG: nucleotidyltransferase family protein [Velocimicrobium sp.]